MGNDRAVTRRSVLIGGGLTAAGLAGVATATPAQSAPRHASSASSAQIPLWQQAMSRGIAYGSSTATWQVEPDPDYSALFQAEAGILFTEDDLLWYRLKPTPTSPLDFSFGDRI